MHSRTLPFSLASHGWHGTIPVWGGVGQECSIRGDIRTPVDYLICLLEMDDFRFNRISTGWLDGASFFLNPLLFPSAWRSAFARCAVLCWTSAAPIQGVRWDPWAVGLSADRGPPRRAAGAEDCLDRIGGRHAHRHAQRRGSVARRHTHAREPRAVLALPTAGASPAEGAALRDIQ